MPVGPVGNMNFINQNMNYTSTQVSNELAMKAYLNLDQQAQKTLVKLETVNKTNKVEKEIKDKKEEKKEDKKNKNKKQGLDLSV